tara:strand:- start:2331 stop:3689 length:1359 start_codon:yes stop_codon:yes gene_type:complete
MSMGLLIGLINLIAEAEFKKYYRNLKKNKFFIAILIFFIFHLVGMIWSENMDYGFNDIRRKLSMLVVPIILISKPISSLSDYKKIIFCFIGALIVTSVINTSYFFWLSDNSEHKDLRELSLFNSHIRYAIMIALAIPLLYQCYTASKKRKVLFAFLVIWFLFYTYVSQVLTGVISLCAILLAYLIYQWIVRGQIKFMWILLLAFVCGFGFTYKAFFSEYKILKYTDIDFYSMQQEWIKKSKSSFDGLDERGQELKFTAARFLHSKDLPPNGTGVKRLLPVEVEAIENGKANVKEMEMGFWGRIEGLRYQLHHPSDPNGHSLLQRYEAWKTGFEIYKDHYLLGTGTGDIDDSFTKKYRENKSKLTAVNQIRGHNMYLTSLLTFGPIGLFLFLYLIGVHIKIQLQSKQFIGFVFMTVMVITFLFEDTLETQTGITLFSFFAALYSIPLPSLSND